MRPGADYPMAHGPTAAPTSGAATSAPRSPWQSPVPYLFGGLAAMLGLIALSLLALACSYQKHSGTLAGPDREAGAESRADGEKGSAAGEWLGHVVVIMAGDEQPTFLATPASSRAVDAVGPGAHVVTSCGPGAHVVTSCGAGGSEGKMVQCEASAQSAGSQDDARSQSRSEQTSSVISGT